VSQRAAQHARDGGVV